MLKPPIHWYGGKQKLVDDLLPYIPEHECYVEPYGGAAALLFAKEPSKVEIYNDLHEDVVNLYVCLRDYYDRCPQGRDIGLKSAIEMTPYAREELRQAWELITYRDINSGLPAVLVERARCFFVLARQSFSARHGAKPGWSSSKKTNHALAWTNAIEGLPEIHERLKVVQIECRPAIEVIEQYDGRDTFQYLDPPYLHETRKETSAYSHEMDDDEHFNLLCLVKRLKSMFLISGYHNELYDDVLAGWKHKDFDARASAINPTAINGGAETYRTETIWWNDALEVNRVGAQIYMDLEVLL